AHRIQVTGDGTVGGTLATLEGGANGAAAGQLVGHTHGIQVFGDVAHYAVGEAGGAGDGQHLQQYLTQVLHVGSMFGGHGASFGRAQPGWLRGNNMSMKLSAVGWGSWLARPGRSLASMMT